MRFRPFHRYMVYLFFFKDISQRKDAEYQITMAKENYHNLFNASPIPKWVYDGSTLRFIDVNEAAIQHYGYSRQEFLSMTLRNIIPEDDQDTIERILQNGKNAIKFNKSTLRHLKKSGELIFVNAERKPIIYNDREARLVLAIDVT